MPWPTTYNSNGLIQVTLEGSIHGQQTNNVFWFSRPGELGAPDWATLLPQLATALLECAVTHLLPGLSSQFTLIGVRAKLMSVADKQEAFVAAAANSVGALGESLPSFVAGVIQWRTPYSGKSRRGRSSFAGIPEANQALTQMSGTPVTQLVAFAACVLGKFKWDTGTEGFDLIIFSRHLGYTPPSTYTNALNNYAPVSTATVRVDLGSVNSRKLRRGA